MRTLYELSYIDGKVNEKEKAEELSKELVELAKEIHGYKTDEEFRTKLEKLNLIYYLASKTINADEKTFSFIVGKLKEANLWYVNDTDGLQPKEIVPKHGRGDKVVLSK